MNSEQDTLPNLQTVLDALNNFREGMSEKLNDVNRRFDDVDRRFDRQDAKFEDLRLQLMSFDVRIARRQAMLHKSLSIAFDNRANEKVLRKELFAWSKGFRDLQNRDV